MGTDECGKSGVGISKSSKHVIGKRLKHFLNYYLVLFAMWCFGMETKSNSPSCGTVLGVTEISMEISKGRETRTLLMYGYCK